MLKPILIVWMLLLLAHSTSAQSLKLYPERNLQGEAQSLENGYYRDADQPFSDWVASFELAPGHIATFADNRNGTGASRVYIAGKEELSINLPPSLQKKASFVRVGPWRNTRKKSACAAGNQMFDALDTSWFYNWGVAGKGTDSVQFVPMSWGGGKDQGMKKLGKRMDVSHHLGFNEPDGENQANMTVDKAIEKYKTLQASGLRLGSPSPKDNQAGRVWLDKFMAKALKEGLRVDFIAVHYYKKGRPEQFRQWLKYLDNKYRLPIWITEFNYGAPWNWKAQPTQAYVSGLVSYMEMLDEAPFVERYAYFNWQPPSDFSIYASKNPEVLSAAGKAFSKHRSPESPLPQNYVPVPWTDNPIGAFYPVSRASFVDGKRGGTYQIQAAGTGISAANDQCHYVHQSISSDASIEARVTATSGAAGKVKAGIMVRESQAPDSKYFMIALTALTEKNQAIVHFRSKTGEKAREKTVKSLAGNPDRIRVVRAGGDFIASVSAGTGKSWQEVIRRKINMNETLSYGLCVTSAKPGESAMVSFDQVRVKSLKK